MPQRLYIAELEPAQLIQGAFAIQNCQLGQTKGGKPYIKCLLADKTGRTPARMWNATEDLFNTLPTDGFVFIEGQTQPYQGEMQIIVNRIRPHEPTDTELRELLPSTDRNVDEMFSQVLGLLQSLQDPAVRALADRYLEDGGLMERFCAAPAATTLHHAYLGGLLEHTLSVMTLAEAILPSYPQVNRDIVLMGLFVHDLGKCAELNWSQGFGYSDDGQLVGHIARGAIWLEEKARACETLEDGPVKIPAAVLRVLQHIILSHHGVPEFGALKLPATPEALLVSMIDNLDAKMNMAVVATRGGGVAKSQELGGAFTEKIWALGTRFYRPDPTTVSD